jgi:hypothetical protein
MSLTGPLGRTVRYGSLYKQRETLYKNARHLPLNLLVLANVLINDAKVVLLQVLNLGNIIRLTVKIVRVERPNSLEHLMILLVHHPPVRILLVPGVERVVADHRKALIRDGRLILHDVVEILIMSPRQHDVVHSAARYVDAMLGAVDVVIVVGITLEGVGVDDALVEGAADRECVADNVPLALGVVEEEQLAQVVDQADELEPAGLAVAADRTRR